MANGADDATLLAPTGAQAPHAPNDEEGPLHPGQDFGSRYRIIRLLGLGGMGAVYQARDKELDLVVAIKVIRPEAAADPAMEAELEARFKRELLLAREVSHKNVVRIHDLGEIEGIKYITMSFIEGEELRVLMKKRGRLPVPEVLTIMRSVVAGLGAAHDAGVVHRDLKPANIMVDAQSGEGIIMDFGIARSTSGQSDAPVPGGRVGKADFASGKLGHTQAGAIVGTITYMSPEQSRGEQADWRSDIYSLGLIFYDMVVGEPRAERAEIAISELSSRCRAAPPPARTLVPELPEAVDEIVTRCLAPDPEDRFEHPRDLRAALDRLDEKGEPLPVTRRLTRSMMATAVVLVLLLVAGTWWLTASRGPVEVPDPVSVLIADFENLTGDPAFDGTLEPTLIRALDGAGFVTTYDRRRLRALAVQPRDELDNVAAREVAVQAGVGYVLTGMIEPHGNAYQLSMSVNETVTGKTIAELEGRARNRDQVIDTATSLISRVRRALGDDTSESAQQFAMGPVSATSLEVVGHYAAAMEASSANRFEEARAHASKAVEVDPSFGVGYLLLAVASGNLDQAADRDRYLQEALRNLDGMTERERYATRGYSYWVSGDYEQCVKEYGDLIRLYPADVGGRNQLALCLSNLREMRRAMEEVQEIVKILPSHPLFRDNLALYANYASNFSLAEETALTVEGPDAYAGLALAFSQMGQGRWDEAAQTYQRLEELPWPGPTFATSGRGDLSSFHGRFSEAVEILREGAEENLANGNSGSAAAKLAAAAHAELSAGRPAQAIATAEEALKHSESAKIRFLSARTFVEAGDTDRALPLIESLQSHLYAEPRAYAKVLEGMIALSDGDASRSVTLLREANDLFETWIGLFEIGRA